MLLYKTLVVLVLVCSSYSACPTNCATCTADETKCLTCTAPATFIPSTSLCQACSVANCQSCDISGKCLVCKPAYQALMTSSGLTCVAQCPIKNCKTCTTTAGVTSCTACLDGFFGQPLSNTCIPCRSPCGVCTLSPTIYNDKIYGTVKTAITAAFTGVTTIPVTQGSATTMAVPAFITNMINNAKDLTVATNWTIAYFLYKAFTPYIPVSIDVKKIGSALIRVSDTLYNIHTIPEMYIAVLSSINTILNTKFTMDDLTNRMNIAISLQTSCTTCLDTYILDTTCKSCIGLIANCLLCSDTTTCTKCINGFYLNSATPPVCTACSANCIACTSTNCVACAAPYTLDNAASGKACQLCKDPCATCTKADTSVCVTCKQPFSSTPTAAGGVCYRCVQDSCLTCDQATAAICSQCRDGFNLLANGTCVSCKQKNCMICSDITCYQCASGYRLNSTTGICQPCGPGCLTCSITNSSICSKCKDGSYNDLISQTCKPCSSACLTCTNPTSCTIPKPGIVIFNNQSITCRPGCQNCDPLNPQNCITCSPRYILSSSVCQPCPFGCDTCSSTTVCTKCSGNLQLIGGVCTPCQGNCSTCNSADTTQCTSCIAGYNYVSASKLCTRSCAKGCQVCSDADATKCVKCSLGYGLKSDSSCVKCLKTCSGACDPKNVTTCLSCVDGFYLADNQCKNCPLGCRSCTLGQCSLCAQGYKLSTDAAGNSVCKQSCAFPCSSCSNSGICYACESGYILSAHKVCVADNSCNPNCQFCPIGTFNSATLPAITCTRCTAQACATCPSDTCKTCLDGYYFSSGSCLICGAQCVTCYDLATCKICAPGYTKQLITLGTDASSSVFNNTCLKCDSNCATCDIQVTRCTSCPTDTYLVGSRCVNMYTVGFKYKLNIAYSTFLSSGEGQKFIAKIAQIAGVSIDDAFINSITQGSTDVTGSVSSSGQTNANQIQQSLSSGNTGYSVLSSAVTVYYGDSQVPPTETTTNGPNVGLIVGVTIGSVAAAVIIAIIIYKVVQSKQEQGHARIQDTSYAKDKIGTNDKIRQ